MASYIDIATLYYLLIYDNCIKVYDNLIEGTEARLLFRLSDVELVRYADDLPAWASSILSK